MVHNSMSWSRRFANLAPEAGLRCRGELIVFNLTTPANLSSSVYILALTGPQAGLKCLRIAPWKEAAMIQIELLKGLGSF